MRLLGFEITRKAATVNASPVPYTDSGSWWRVFSTYSPQWFQRDMTPTTDTILAYHAVYACITLIAADIGKLRNKLVALDDDGIWNETTSAAFTPVLRKPNRFQNHIQFKEWWITSKLIRGNAYAMKERDQRGVVVRLYLLDSCRVQPMVAPDGAVYYRLGTDNLAGITDADLIVPASEIIHDRMNCLFHPLVGTSPIFACGMAADHGLRIQRDSSSFFGNSSVPSGILTAPGEIPEQLAQRMKDKWNDEYSGANSGRVAVLGGGLKFEPMRMTSVDAQVVEQLKMTAEIVCSVFHVPAYMVGVGPAPLNNNVEALAAQYYAQCLQSHIESMELCQDEGLGLDVPKDGIQYGTELDLDGLLRMDSATQITTLKNAVDGTLMTPNEGRWKLNLRPVDGGNALYKQVQNVSLAALARRDENTPAAPATGPNAPALPAPTDKPGPDDEPSDDGTDGAKKFVAALTRQFVEAAHARF